VCRNGGTWHRGQRYTALRVSASYTQSQASRAVTTAAGSFGS
jgi:hypothetical protein